MNVLILGENGYLGSKLVHALIKRNMNLVCTKRANSNLCRIEDVLADTRIKFVSASIDAIKTVLQYDDFDWVLNLACNYGRSNVLYGSVIEANIEFPLNVLNQAVEKGIKNFLTIGTGLPDELNMYSFSKKIFSEFGKFYVEKHGVNFYNLKLEMFYGSNEPRERFIPSLIYNMLSGNDVNVTLGTQKRDIIAVEDILYAIIQIVECGPEKMNGGIQQFRLGQG